MSSSEDDRPLARNGNRINGTGLKSTVVLPDIITPSVDRQMDSEQMDVDTNVISLQNGPIKEESPSTARNKRKARKPALKEESEEDEEVVPRGKRLKVVNGAGAPKKAPIQDSDSEDDMPLASKRAAAKRPPTKLSAVLPILEGGNSSDSDQPLVAKTLSNEKKAILKKQESTAKTLRQQQAIPAKRKAAKQEPDSDSDTPLVKSKPTAISAAAKKKTNGVAKKEEVESDDDESLLKATKKTPKTKAPAKANGKKAAVKEEKPKPAAKGKGKAKEESPQEDEEEEDDEYKWWEQQENDGSTKWKTLEHNGVVFPPPYEPLPSNVKLVYDGTPVILPVQAEEVAGFFGAMLDSTTHMENPKFVSNFFKDFTTILKKHGGAKTAAGKKIEIKSFEKMDFHQIYEYFEQKKNEKKNMTPAEKKALKAEKDKQEEPYQFCYLDGRKEKVGNFRIEPPGLFRGRGEHPKTGMVKSRVQPEQVTINISKGSKVPQPPPGHKWQAVVHDPTVTWLATWKENINGNIKYVMLAATSSVKGMSDFKKFEKARELKSHIDRIRKDYRKELREKLMEIRQRATAMYLIDLFALRAGNEKGEEEADTVGCCSLRFEHVTLEQPNLVIFDFLGKDSIRFYNKFEVDPQVFKNLKIFKKEPKGPGDKIFDRLNTTDLNKHLQAYMPGLSAKVFRTYNASFTMQQELAKLENSGTVAEKVLKYNAANRTVAILCNHQRTVTKGHESQIERTENKIKGMKYQCQRLKRMILALEPKMKKKDPEFFADDPELDQEWIEEHQEWLIQQEKEKIEKKFKKENEKLIADDEKPQPDSVLKERLSEVNEMAAMFKKENKTGKVEPEGRAPSVERFEANIKKLEEKIEATQMQMQDKEDNKTVALGTSKINYIDPRLTVMFCKKFDVPLERVFPKTLREKFKWAIESADENWEF